MHNRAGRPAREKGEGPAGPTGLNHDPPQGIEVVILRAGMESAAGEPRGLAHGGAARCGGMRTGMAGTRKPFGRVVIGHFGHNHHVEGGDDAFTHIPGPMQRNTSATDRIGIVCSARSGSRRFECAQQDIEQHGEDILYPHRHLVYHITRREDTLFLPKSVISGAKKRCSVPIMTKSGSETV